MTLAAALKRKLAIAPIRPGSSEAAFSPTVLRPFAKPFPSFFKALVIAPMTAPIVAPAARKMAVTVTPFFLKISFIFSRRDLLSSSPRSRSVCSRRSEIHSLSLSRCVILSSAASISKAVEFKSPTIFYHLQSTYQDLLLIFFLKDLSFLYQDKLFYAKSF